MPKPRFCGGIAAMSWPSSRTVPLSGRTKPAAIIKVVVLPEPEGPSSEKNSPGAIDRAMALTTVSSP
jgi:hypothetical protein